TYISDAVVTTNSDGFATATLTTPAANDYIAATATDASGNTSQFSMVDTDGDGLADSWETSGIDVNLDGTSDLTLAVASALRKDLCVEYDSMNTLAPPPAAISDVVTTFANAPSASINNPPPNQSLGINLHADNGGDPSITLAPWNATDSGGFP